MAKFTEGPWEVFCAEDRRQPQFTSVIAAPGTAPDQGQLVVCDLVGLNREANAHLIAAAPDYHENAREGIEIARLLRDFTRKIGDMETRDRCNRWIEKQLDAFQKANGYQS